MIRVYKICLAGVLLNLAVALGILCYFNADRFAYLKQKVESEIEKGRIVFSNSIGLPWSTRGKAEQLLGYGRGIFTACHVEGCGGMITDDTYRIIQSIPSGKFQSSTDFFKFTVASKIIDTNFSFFGVERLAPDVIDNPLFFTASNNVWCVVNDVGRWGTRSPMNKGELDTNFPVYFSSNIHLNKLSDPLTKDDIYGPPFGEKAAVVVSAFGGGTVLMGVDEIVEYFENLNATNKVLRP